VKLKDIRVGKRLFIGFGIMNLILVGICAFGLSMITVVNGSLEQIVGKNDVLTKAAYDMKDGLNTANLSVLAALTATDEANRAKSDGVINASRLKYGSAVEVIDKLETSEEGKGLIKDIKDTIASGRTVNDKAMELSKSGKTGEAAASFMTDGLPLVTKALEGCDGFITYQQKRTATLAAGAKTFYRSCFIFVIIGAILSVAIGVGIALILARSIVEPVNRTISHSRLLSEGNLRQEIIVDRKDEFGEQAATIKSMVEKWRDIIGSVKQASDSVASAGTQLSASAGQMSHGASQQAERAHQVATSSEEMSQTVEEIARNATTIATTAAQAAKTAKDGGTIVEAAVREVGKPYHFSVGALQEDRRYHRHHQRDRGPDEPPRAERSDRGGPGRRAREGFRGGRRRGKETRRENHRRHLRGERHYKGNPEQRDERRHVHRPGDFQGRQRC